MKTFVPTLIAFLVAAVTLHAASEFKLQIINNVADPAAGKFTVKVNGKNFGTGELNFRQATPLTTVKLPATLSITSEAYPGVDREFTAELYEGGTVLMTLYGVSDPTKFATPDQSRDISFVQPEFILLPDAVQASKVNVTVLHSATDLPKMDISTVGDNPLVTDIDYSQTSTIMAALPAKKFVFNMHKQGDQSEIWKTVSADLSQDVGKHIFVMPSGFQKPADNQNGPALELIGVYPDGKVVVFPTAGEMKKAKLQVVHASADPAAESVDIYVNGTKMADNIGFRGASAYVDVPAAENLSIVVAQPNSNSFDDKVLTTLTASQLSENGKYMIVLHGVVAAAGFASNPDGKSIAMSLYSVSNPRMSASNASMVDIMAFHAATDANSIDIVPRGGSAIASSMAYGSSNASGYVAVAPGDYTIDITPAMNHDVVLQSYTANLAPLAGQAVVLVAGGFLDPLQNKNGSPLGLFAVSTNGTVSVFAAVPVGVGEQEQVAGSLAVAPNPAGETAFVSCELPAAAPVVLSVYDVSGRTVKTINQGTVPAGRLSLPVSTIDLAPGVYMLTIQAGSYTASRTLTVVK